MHGYSCFLASALWFLITACGPDIIMVRPHLDSPTLHVSNGNLLLDRGKAEHALREFNRAQELDPENAQAYAGMAVILILQGDLEEARRCLEKAQRLAESAEDRQAVEVGMQQYNEAVYGRLGP